MREQVINQIRLLSKYSSNKICIEDFETCEHANIINEIEKKLDEVTPSCFRETSRIFSNVNSNNQYSMF